MNETVRKVDYFYLTVPDTPGQAAKVLRGLAAEGINFLAFSGFPSARKGQLDLIPEDPAALKKGRKNSGSSSRLGRPRFSPKAKTGSALSPTFSPGWPKARSMSRPSMP